MRAMIMKEFRELRRDKRTVAMLVGLPLMLLVIFGFAANFTISTLTVTAVGPGAEAIESAAKANPQVAGHLDFVHVDTAGTDADARNALRDDDSDIAIVASQVPATGAALPGGPEGTAADGPAAEAGAAGTGSAADAAKPTIYIDGSNLFAAQSAKVLVANLGDAVNSEILYNPDLDTAWVMVPALIGLILTFIGTIITSIGLVKEREAGTLEQLAVMPLRPSAVILGKITPYFLLACLDMVAITLLGMWIFSVPFNGPVLPFILGAGLFLFVVLGIGALISTVSQNTGQAVQVALMTMLPQILLSGMIFPLDAMAAGVRWIGYLLPLTWFTKVSQGVMIRGASWGALWLPLAILALMAVVIFGAAVLRLSRELRPARTHRDAPADPALTGPAADVVAAR